MEAALLVAAASAPAAGAPNALTLPGNEIVPLYAVAGSAGVQAVAYRPQGTNLQALDQAGRSVWTQDVGAFQALIGGFDFDGDGWPDAGLVRVSASGEYCGAIEMNYSWITFVSGKDGALYGGVAPLLDKCWSFPGTTYPTQQWTQASVLWGKGTTTLALLPTYADTGWYFSFQGGRFVSLGSFIYPSTPSYDETYPAAQFNPYATGTKYRENSHAANGFILAGQNVLQFVTSNRLARYQVGPLSPQQLLLDVTYLNGGRTDIAGRNYGVFAQDPYYPANTALLAGTGVESVFYDKLAGKMYYDTWGGIERHVDLFNADTGAMAHRFYSYAHDPDNTDQAQYEGRVVYPSHPFLKTADGRPSRIAYNVYAGGRWWLHISQPGSVDDLATIEDHFLWDIADVDGDGAQDLVMSPVRFQNEPDVPGYYFPKWLTVVRHWNEAAGALSAPVYAFNNLIPYLVSSFDAPPAATRNGSLFPVLTVAQGAQKSLVLVDSAGRVQLGPVGSTAYADAGLRLSLGAGAVAVAAETPAQTTSPLRIRTAQGVYGLALVDPSDPLAAGLRVRTSQGVKALRRLGP